MDVILGIAILLALGLDVLGYVDQALLVAAIALTMQGLVIIVRRRITLRWSLLPRGPRRTYVFGGAKVVLYGMVLCLMGVSGLNQVLADMFPTLITSWWR